MDNHLKQLKQPGRLWLCRFVFLLLAELTLAISGLPIDGSDSRWQPPGLASIEGPVGRFDEIEGTQKTAESIREKLLVQTEKPGRWVQADRIRLIVPSGFQNERTIRLVSGSEPDEQSQLDLESSDLEVASVARQRGIDHLLRGEIIEATGREVLRTVSGWCGVWWGLHRTQSRPGFRSQSIRNDSEQAS